MINDLHPGDVVRFELFSIGTYQPQIKHAFNLHSDEEMEEAIAEATDDFEKFTGSKFFGTAASLLELEDEEIEAFIENGWDEPRLRFILETEVPTGNPRDGKMLNTVITGYVDSQEAVDDVNAELAEDTQLYVNNIIQFVSNRTKRGSRVRTNGKALNSRSSNRGSSGNGTNNQTVSTAIEMIQYLDVIDDLDDDELHTPANSGARTKIHNSRELIAGNYVSSGVRALTLASRNAPNFSEQLGQSYAMSEIADTASGMVNESRELKEIGVLAAMLFENEDFVDTGCFEFRDLLRLYPNIDDMTNIAIIDAEELSHAEDGDILDNSDEALVALLLAMTLPTVTFDNLIGVAEIDIDSLAEPGEAILISTARPLIPEHEDVDLLDAFEKYVNHTLDGLLDDWNRKFGDVSARIIVDALGTTTVAVSIGGRAERTYLIPQFADNALTPLLTNDVSSTINISECLLNLGVRNYEARVGRETPLR